jgi:hypothetical protein
MNDNYVKWYTYEIARLNYSFINIYTYIYIHTYICHIHAKHIVVMQKTYSNVTII